MVHVPQPPPCDMACMYPWGWASPAALPGVMQREQRAGVGGCRWVCQCNTHALASWTYALSCTRPTSDRCVRQYWLTRVHHGCPKRRVQELTFNVQCAANYNRVAQEHIIIPHVFLMRHAAASVDALNRKQTQMGK